MWMVGACCCRRRLSFARLSVESLVSTLEEVAGDGEVSLSDLAEFVDATDRLRATSRATVFTKSDLPWCRGLLRFERRAHRLRARALLAQRPHYQRLGLPGHQNYAAALKSDLV